MMQNGVSRKTIVFSRILTIITSSIALAVLNELITLVCRIFVNFNKNIIFEINILQVMYPQMLGEMESLPLFLINILFWSLALMMATLLGYCVSSLLYHLSRTTKIILGVALSVFAVVLLPIIDVLLVKGIYKKLLDFFLMVMGQKSQNPFIAVITFLVSTVILGGISYLLVIRAQVQK